MSRYERLEHYLVQEMSSRGLLSSDEARSLKQLFHDSDKTEFTDFLIDQGFISRESLLELLGAYYKVPATDALGTFFDSHLLHMFPKDFLLRSGAIPLEAEENMMVLIVSDPEDETVIAQLGQFVPHDIRVHVGLRVDICDAVKDFYDKSLTEVDGENEEPL